MFEEREKIPCSNGDIQAVTDSEGGPASRTVTCQCTELSARAGTMIIIRVAAAAAGLARDVAY